MNRKYDELFDIARKVFDDECKATLQGGEEFGTKLFPYISTRRTAGGKSHVLYFNPRLEVVLSLYNIAVIRDINIGKALAYYILFYECLSLDEYDHAETFLTLFADEVERLRLKERLEEMRHETNGFIRYQVLFTLFHEISHEYYRQFDRGHAIATATSKKVMKRISDVLKEMIIGIIAFGLLAQIIGVFIVSQKIVYSAGLWAGIVIAIAMAVHMEYSISVALELGEAGAPKHVQKHSMIRYSCVIIAFVAISFINKNATVPCFIGVMGLKVAAYLQPFTHKIFLKVHENKDSD